MTCEEQQTDTMSCKERFLSERGWYSWYHKDYWCHPQFGGEGKDETFRGMSLEDAYKFETHPEIRESMRNKIDLGASMVRAFSNLREVL